jgi:hypothetical protein
MHRREAYRAPTVTELAALRSACRFDSGAYAMTKPLIVSIPHALGKAEAKRRLQGGVSQLKTQFGAHIASFDEEWANDRMSFRVGLMGQQVSGQLEVLDDAVRVEVQLPWILAMVAEKAKSFIQKQGTLMLEKK